MKKLLNLLKKFIDNPLVQLLIGAILVATSLSEAWETLSHDLTNSNFHSHHGVILYGIAMVLKTLPDCIEGIEKMTK